MAEIQLQSFINRYAAVLKNNARIFPFLRGQVCEPVRMDRYDDVLKRAHEAYAAFDYERVVMGLDGLLQDLAVHPLVYPLSRRDGDSDFRRLMIVRDALQLFERASSWLGVRYFFDGRHEDRGYEILSDIEILDRCIGQVPTVFSARSFRQQRMGRYLKAQRSFEQGWQLVRGNKLLERSLIDAKANLALKLGFRAEALRLYGEVRKLDETIQISPESQGLALAFWGVSRLTIATGSPLTGLTEARDGLAVCKNVGHPGFEAQAKQAIVEALVEFGHIDEALEILSDPLGTEITFQTSSIKRFEAIRLFVEAIAHGKRVGTVNSSAELMERITAVGAITNRAPALLREVSRRTLDALLNADVRGAKVWIAVVTEVITNGLIEFYGIHGGRGTLDAKNQALFLAGIYPLRYLNLIDDMRLLRNELAHGRLDGLTAGRKGSVLSIFQCFHELCRLAVANGLDRHAPNENADERLLHRFLKS